MEELKQKIRNVPDFPKAGIGFKDITTLIKDGQAFKKAIDIISNQYDPDEIDIIVGIESRGFIFASALAYKHRKGFVKIRKSGKLPNIADQIDYGLEYGQSTLEMQKGDHTRLFILDDLIATGGSMGAAAELAQRVGYRVMGLAALVNLESLNNFTWQGMACRSVLKF